MALLLRYQLMSADVSKIYKLQLWAFSNTCQHLLKEKMLFKDAEKYRRTLFNIKKNIIINIVLRRGRSIQCLPILYFNNGRYSCATWVLRQRSLNLG